MYTVVDLKLIAIGIISFGSYFFGILPNLFGLGSNAQKSTLLSSVLCFGAGVLFATSVIHILPDVRKDLSNSSEIVFCLGYLFMYLIDVSTSIWSQQTNSESENGEHDSPTADEITPLVSRESNNTHIRFMDLSLLLAFSLHSLMEGLVIGVEPTKSGVLLLLFAVCSHKLLVAFCLGAELSSGGQPLYAILPALSIFVIGSSLGIGLGILLHPNELPIVGKIGPVLQGLAGGTLLYVVVTEILPREKLRNLPRYSPILQYISLCLGFAFMAGLSQLDQS